MQEICNQLYATNLHSCSDKKTKNKAKKTRVIYNSLLNHFQSNTLSTFSQSGFLPGDSCIA